MSYHVKLKDKSAAKAVKRLAKSQIDSAIAEIDDDTMPPAKTVHQIRKRCKKLRGLIRLVRPAFPDYAKENRKFRDAARELAPVRDAFVMVETIDKLVGHYDGELDKAAFTPFRDELQEAASAASGDEALAGKLADFRGKMAKARGRVSDWAITDTGFDAFAGGLAKTYGRAVDALARAEKKPTPDTMHEWRKRVKYHWYHTRLLRELWPEMIETRRETSDLLGDLLGDHHDLAVFRRRLAGLQASQDHPQAAEILDGIIAERQKSYTEDAFPLGRRLLAETPKAITRRYAEYWETWRTVA